MDPEYERLAPAWFPAATDHGQHVWVLQTPAAPVLTSSQGHKAGAWPQLVEQLPGLVIERRPIVRWLPARYPDGAHAIPSVWRGPLAAGLPLY